MIPVRLIGPRVLVALEPDKSRRDDAIGMEYQDKGRTASGIILAAPSEAYDIDPHSRGIVVALGEKRGICEVEKAIEALREYVFSDGAIDCQFTDVEMTLRNLVSAPFDVQVGDCVIFPPSAGISLGEWDDGIRYVELQESDIWAVIEPNEAA